MIPSSQHRPTRPDVYTPTNRSSRSPTPSASSAPSEEEEASIDSGPPSDSEDEDPQVPPESTVAADAARLRQLGNGRNANDWRTWLMI
jgi:hypothetical protein